MEDERLRRLERIRRKTLRDEPPPNSVLLLVGLAGYAECSRARINGPVPFGLANVGLLGPVDGVKGGFGVEGESVGADANDGPFSGVNLAMPK